MGSINLSALVRHLSDSVKHITAAERTAWNSKAAGTHTHTKSQITDFPTSLPANGGNADTVDNCHAADFVKSNIQIAATNTFSNIEPTVKDDSSNNVYREYIRKTADSATIEKLWRVFVPGGANYSDLQAKGTSSGVVWNFTGASDLQFNGKSVLTSGAIYASGTISRPTSYPYSQTITLGFKPSCIIAMTPPFTRQSPYNTTNAAIIISESGTVYGSVMSSTDDKREITITKTTTGFTAAFSSANGVDIASFNYIAFK